MCSGSTLTLSDHGRKELHIALSKCMLLMIHAVKFVEFFKCLLSSQLEDVMIEYSENLLQTLLQCLILKR